MWPKHQIYFTSQVDFLILKDIFCTFYFAAVILNKGWCKDLNYQSLRQLRHKLKLAQEHTWYGGWAWIQSCHLEAIYGYQAATYGEVSSVGNMNS